MSERSDDQDDQSRLRRVMRLRTAWRTKPREPTPEASSGLRYDPRTDQRRSDALDSHDEIRAEAPDDLETRRRADQLEREIKRPRRPGSRP